MLALVTECLQVGLSGSFGLNWSQLGEEVKKMTLLLKVGFFKKLFLRACYALSQGDGSSSHTREKRNAAGLS